MGSEYTRAKTGDPGTRPLAEIRIFTSDRLSPGVATISKEERSKLSYRFPALGLPGTVESPPPSGGNVVGGVIGDVVEVVVVVKVDVVTGVVDVVALDLAGTSVGEVDAVERGLGLTRVVGTAGAVTDGAAPTVVSDVVGTSTDVDGVLVATSVVGDAAEVGTCVDGETTVDVDVVVVDDEVGAEEMSVETTVMLKYRPAQFPDVTSAHVAPLSPLILRTKEALEPDGVGVVVSHFQLTVLVLWKTTKYCVGDVPRSTSVVAV